MSATGQILQRLQRDRVLQQLAISDTGFLFDPRSGQSFSLNGTALDSLQLLRQGHSLGEAVEELVNRYQCTAEVAEAGLESFVQQLGRHLS